MNRESAVRIEESAFDDVVIQNDQNVIVGSAPKKSKEVFVYSEDVVLDVESSSLGVASFFGALTSAYLKNIDNFMSPVVFIFQSLINNFVTISKLVVAVASAVALTVACIVLVPSINSMFTGLQSSGIEYWFYAAVFFIANMFVIFNAVVVYRAIVFAVKSLYVAVINQSIEK